MQTTVDSEQVRAAVRETYGRIATEQRLRGAAELQRCCGPAAQPYVRGSGLFRRGPPQCAGGADLGLGCGNPQAIAELKAGERVLDLGAARDSTRSSRHARLAIAALWSAST
jgi:hypothetical protein